MITPHRYFLDKKINSILKNKYFEKVLDVGSRHQPYKKIIKFKEYKTLDIDHEQKPDYLVDAQTFTGVPKKKFDLVIATEILEHTENPTKVVENIYSSLKNNGVAVVSAPSIYIDHSEKGINDYYRFMELSGKEIFKNFRKVKVHKIGSTSSAIITLLGNQWKIFRIIFIFNKFLKFGKKGYTGIVIEAKK